MLAKIKIRLYICKQKATTTLFSPRHHGQVRTMNTEIKRKHLEEQWNEYNANGNIGDEVTLAHYVCREAKNDPGFFRWLFDNDELSDFECEDEEEFKDFLKSLADSDKEKTIDDIADENDLEVVETTSQRNGYPSNLCKAVVGFKSFEDAERFASENDLTLIWIDARDGWQLWHRGDTASEPMKITSDDFGDDFNFEYDRDDFMKRAHDVVADMAYQGEEFDDIRAYMEKAEKVADAIENMEESQVVVTYQGEYYYTIEMRPIYFSYDGHITQLAAIKQ